MAKYGWLITKDKIADSDAEPGTNCNAVGVMGPRGITYTEAECRKGEKFRMLDDDGEVYYYGYIVGDYLGFEPLDDFGMPNAGCTEIQYKNSDGEWSTL